jgi:Asp-tRNA(Asn)/Glu-tRNA(Gln) amidotransferase A subunit family amidase
MTRTAATAPRYIIAPPADEICSLSATRLVRSLRARELSAVELLDRVLARADEVADSVNPFSVRLDDAARAAARKADRLLFRGEGGPLTGLPVSVKDSHWLAGVESTYGSRARVGFVPWETLGVVERLADTDAVTFAKTTASEFCYFGISEAPLFGRTNNPPDLSRTAGGSSGGAGHRLRRTRGRSR